jgi:transmembrane sensor
LGVAQESAREARAHEPRRRDAPWGLAAGVGMLFLALGVAWVASRAREWASYTTADNVAQNVVLDDGSVIDVYGASSLRVRYSKALREVELSRGGGQFTVRDEEVRPFVVRVGSGTIEAVQGARAESLPARSVEIQPVQPARLFLAINNETAVGAGTVFNVLRKDKETGVFVSEGKVRVKGEAQEQAVLVAAGQSTDLSADGHVQPVRRVEDLTLRLESSTLAEMAEIFNRHNTVPQIEVIGGARDRKLGVRMRLDNTDELLAALVALGDYRIERRGSSVTIQLKYESAL